MGGLPGLTLDVQGLVDQLMLIESEPVRRLQRQEAGVQQRIEAYRSLQTLLSQLAGRVSDLNSRGAFDARSALSSDPNTLTASAGPQAAIGAYEIQVQRLARFDSFVSQGTFASSDAPLSQGSFQLSVGGQSAQIQLDAGNNTLDGLRDAINRSGLDAQASIINDGSGFRLVVTATESGAAHALSFDAINVQGPDGSPLSFDRTHTIGDVQELDALFTVNGLTLTSGTNSPSDAIEGLTLELKGIGSTSLTISNDGGQAKDLIQGFVEAYNELAVFINGQFSFDEAAGGGVLANDGTLRRIQSDLSQIIRNIAGDGPLTSLRSLGLDLKVDGTLEIDESRLDQVLQDHFSELKNLFSASIDDGIAGLSLIAAGGAAQGRYEINVTQAAEQAQVIGPQAIAGVLGVDETLTVNLNGALSTVQLTSGQTLAQIVQAINARLSADGVAATAFADQGRLALQSDQSGANVSLTVLSSTTQGTGFGPGGLSDAGTDARAVIKNLDTGESFDAQGLGNILTVSQGSASGLSLRIPSDSLGVLGQFDLSLGYAERFDRLLDQLADDLGGPVAGVLQSLDSRVRRIDDDIAQLEERLELRRQRLVAEFTRAEQALQQLSRVQSSLGNLGSSLSGFLPR